jgi:hypothetical protein
MDLKNRLWLSVGEAAPLIGIDPQGIYRLIRINQFPFAFVRIGSRIKISSRSIGLIPLAENHDDKPQTEPHAASAAAK